MARLPENKERRLQGLNQDVLAVPAPMQSSDNAPIPLGTHKKAVPVRVADTGRSGVVWFALALALAAAALAGTQWFINQETRQELSELRQEFYQLASAQTEPTPTADPQTRPVAVATPPRVDPADISHLREDLRELSGKVRGITVSLAKMGNGRDDTAALEKRLNDMDKSLNALSGRLTALANRQPKVTPVVQQAAAAPQVDTHQVSALSAKVNKIDKDLQALYRILQGG